MGEVIEILRWQPVKERYPPDNTEVIIWVQCAGEQWCCNAYRYKKAWIIPYWKKAFPKGFRVLYWATVRGPAI